MSKYIEHKQFYLNFTLYPFTTTEHFDVKTPNYNVTSHFFQNVLPCCAHTCCDNLPICCKCHKRFVICSNCRYSLHSSNFTFSALPLGTNFILSGQSQGTASERSQWASAKPSARRTAGGQSQLGVLIMLLNIQLSSNNVNISDKYAYCVIKYAFNMSM